MPSVQELTVQKNEMDQKSNSRISTGCILFGAGLIFDAIVGGNIAKEGVDYVSKSWEPITATAGNIGGLFFIAAGLRYGHRADIIEAELLRRDADNQFLIQSETISNQ